MFLALVAFLLTPLSFPVISFPVQKTKTPVSAKVLSAKINPSPTSLPTSTPKPLPIIVNSKAKSTPIPTLTTVPTVLPKSTTPIPTQAPKIPISGVSSSSFVLNEINEYRRSRGLPSVQSEPYSCAFAIKRAGEIASSFNHDGFRDYPYPSYSSVNENIAMNSNYEAIADQWINSQRHAENLAADVPFGCVGVNGNFYVWEAWKP